jgi:hypothetical protein
MFKYPVYPGSSKRQESSDPVKATIVKSTLMKIVAFLELVFLHGKGWY